MEKHVLEQKINIGLSTRKIAKELNTSLSTVRYWLKKYSIKTDPIYHSKYVKFYCTKCGEKEHKNFYPDVLGFCKKCHNYRRTEYGRNIKTLAIEHKGGKCSKCGYKKCIGALEFHHTDPKKKDPSFKTLIKGNFEKLKKELEKCVLLCANCHREEHNNAPIV